MNNILIIGAGRSASALINYILQEAAKFNWSVVVADADESVARQKMHNHPNGKSASLDVMNADERNALIRQADLVISLLPAHLHYEVAKDCILHSKHLITASYVTKELYALDAEARKRGLIFMGEIGLDPGIDHMSAKQKIDEICEKGGKLTAFRSYTGGLIAPENDTNPWHYKFTWNPRNVILAGQGTAQYLENSKYKYIPYNRLFEQYETIEVPGHGTFEAYANRDSLSYRSLYGLENIPNILRGTIRYPGFCSAWNALVKIGLTDDSFSIPNTKGMTCADYTEAFLPPFSNKNKSLKERTADFLNEEHGSPVIEKLEWLGLFSQEKISISAGSPAMILENLLLEKWKLQADDKDMIVMQHEFEYEIYDETRTLTSTLVHKGNDAVDTAMAQLVGLPVGIFAKLVMLGKVSITGVNIPVMKEVYDPVLEELEKFGVQFIEKELKVMSKGL